MDSWGFKAARKVCIAAFGADIFIHALIGASVINGIAKGALSMAAMLLLLVVLSAYDRKCRVKKSRKKRRASAAGIVSEGWRKMDDVFIYEWQEPPKGYILTPKLIVHAVFLAAAVGLVHCMMFLFGGDKSSVVYHAGFMAVAVPAAIVFSVLSCRKVPGSMSSLAIYSEGVTVARHVVSETGRRYFAVWESLEITGWKYDEACRILQVNAEWDASAYRMRGGRPGRFVDSEVCRYPQTFLLDRKSFDSAMACLRAHCPDMLSPMTPEEYEEALPFIHKHHET